METAPEPVPGNKTQLTHKCLLHQFAQKFNKHPPIYLTYNEGTQREPKFRSVVHYDGIQFSSPNTFSHRKQAEMEVSKVAYFAIAQKIKIDGANLICEDPVYCKSILVEYCDVKGFDKPSYQTIQPAENIPVYYSNVVFNGVTYSGAPSTSKKEAEKLAAREVILSILGSESEATMSGIIGCKSKLYAALRKVKETYIAQKGTAQAGRQSGTENGGLHNPNLAEAALSTNQMHTPLAFCQGFLGRPSCFPSAPTPLHVSQPCNPQLATAETSPVASYPAASLPPVASSPAATSPSPIASFPAVKSPPPVASFPLVTSQPPVALFPLVASQPPVAPSPVVTSQPPVAPSPVVTSQPPVVSFCTVTSQPPVASSPMITSQPPLASSATVTPQPPVASSPTVTSRPSVASSPVATSQPPVALSPTVTSQPPVASSPTVTNQPSASFPAVTSQPPVASSPAITPQPPIVSSPVVTTQPPVVSSPAVTSQAPVTPQPPVKPQVLVVEPISIAGPSTGKRRNKKYKKKAQKKLRLDSELMHVSPSSSLLCDSMNAPIADVP